RAIAGKQHEPTSPGKRPIVIRGKLARVSRVGQAVHLEFGGRIGIASPFRRETLTLFSLTVQRGRRQSREEGSPGSAHSLMVAGKRRLDFGCWMLARSDPLRRQPVQPTSKIQHPTSIYTGSLEFPSTCRGWALALALATSLAAYTAAITP